MSSPGLVVLAAGGTGGHMFPAEALARALLTRGRRVALVTDSRGESFGEHLPGVALHRIRAGRFSGNLLRKALGLVELAFGILEAGRHLRTLGPAAVVGFGGYPSVPTMLAAVRQKRPTVIHEQNAILGRANRLLASRACAIATSFAEVAGLSAADRSRVAETGNPVRPAVAALRGTPYVESRGDDGFELLVLGGSQGAHILSATVPPALALLPEPLRRRLRLTQQARPEDLDVVRAAYAAGGISAEIRPFFDDVPARLARAQLVIARSGASTVAELAVMGRPAILVPYRYAADDHQTANARALEAAGAAWVMAESAFTPDALFQRIVALMDSPETLAKAARAADGLGRPDAAERLADLVLATAGDAVGEAAA
jgi:UDP-N-acetylglucosamine--N-acetylmuramyl-(pentapeptide) pyrophosphoryl-undecaprenol N-acetylglucosamine transferase